ncbi:MAG TPA: hypothetical protein VGO52_16240, partial [Hyphomonadaceae bacterium]|nr:hypothetical protein [Hyphomonadaceae bacterium]
EIQVVIPGDLPDSGVFHMTGYVNQGELTIEGFPSGRNGEIFRFMAQDGHIAHDYNGEWYDSPTSVRFKPDSSDAVCSIRIRYRMKNEWSRIFIGSTP